MGLLSGEHLLLARRLSAGAVGPLLSFVALFALPILGAAILDDREFAFWSLLATIATVALSLDFGGVALVTARFYSEPRGRLLWKASILSVAGALIVGILACILWIPYRTTDMGRSISDYRAIAAIATMSLASAVRSVLIVIAQAALVSSRLAIRNFAIAGHAFGAVAVSLLILVATHSFWALPIGWLISGIVISAIVLPWSWQTFVSAQSAVQGTTIIQPFEWRKFAGIRTISALSSAVLLASDRWIIGAFAGPSLLATYELAWRFAFLPRFFVQNLVIRVGADVALLGRSDRPHVASLLRRTVRIAVVAGSSACFPVALAYGAFTSIAGLATNWSLFGAMLAAFTIVSFAAPLSLSGSAVGNAWLDLPYLFTVLAVSGIAAYLSHHFDRPSIFIVTYLAASGICIFWYFRYGPALISRGLETREALADG